MKVRLTVAFSTAILCLLLAFVSPSLCWSNGGFSSDPLNTKYGTHDWIAEHALDWLPDEAKRWILANKALYLYGTELPDNGQAPDGIGDTQLHHVYFYADGRLMDDSSAVRANATYRQSLGCLLRGDMASAAKYAGAMTHYISDVAVFGHVMGKATPWGEEVHHSDYESYVNSKTSSYHAEFNAYLRFDGSLDIITAYDAAVRLAYDTTFDSSGRGLTCVWMDQNYNWSDPTFRDRAGESLNLAVNLVTDVLYTLYVEYKASQEAPATAVVRFEVSGLSADASGTVLIVDGVGYSYSQLPVSFTWEVGSQHSFSWTDPVSAGSGKRYAWVSTSGLSTSRSGTINVPSSGGSVAANYKTQYLWIFAVDGLGSDVWSEQTVAVIEVGEGRVESFAYGGTNTLASFWWDEGSRHGVRYVEYVESTVDGKRYANHNPPSLNITVVGPGNITAHYHAEFRVDVGSQTGRGTTDPPSGSYWVDEGATFTVKAIPDAGYVFSEWSGTTTSMENPLTIEVYTPHMVRAKFIESFDFSVSAVPGAANVKKGAMFTFAVNVEHLKGVPEAVSLSVSGLPAGANYSLTMPSGQPPFTSMLTIITSQNTPAGTFHVAIEASSGNLTRTAYISLTVTDSRQAPIGQLPPETILIATLAFAVTLGFISIIIKLRKR